MTEKVREMPLGLDMTATGKRINRLIKVSGMKSKDISEALGVSVQAVSKWCHGKNLPDTENLYILSRMLGIKVDDLLVPYAVKKENGAEAFSASLIRRLTAYSLCFKVRRSRFSTTR